MSLQSFFLVSLLFHKSSCFWDMGTTTESMNINKDDRPRQSMFRWQETQFDKYESWFTNWDWVDLHWRRKMAVTCAYSVYFTNLSVGVILNRRTTLTSANFLEPWKNVEADIRVWCLGRAGTFYSPYRYRVWRSRRVIPRSDNPEHWHGPRGQHVPRHDLAVVQTMDQMYIYPMLYWRWHYATRAFLKEKHSLISQNMMFTGSCYEDAKHIRENYKIYYAVLTRDLIVDCSKYLPKWWGKFVCFRNPTNAHKRIACVNNGGPLIDDKLYIMGIGCFEIRYNEERILVFTDVRYYIDLIHVFANISAGEYYEYAYQTYGNTIGWSYDGSHNNPFMPSWYVMYDLYPLGK